MSADNWRVCPRCRERVDKENEARAIAPGRQYGKVPEAEFIELVNKSKSPIPYEETLREDYEIGIVKTDRDTKSQFYVYYSARCTTCKFAFKYRHEENV